MKCFVDKDIDYVLKLLKRKMQKEGFWKVLKLKRGYEKPSEERMRKKAEAIKRHRKAVRKKNDKDSA